MAGSPDGIGAAKVTSAQFHLASVPGTKAFAASPEDLSKKGYLEEEYYVTGTAGRYRFPDPMNNAAVADGSYGYKTRMMVRRPADPAKFNGTVIAEWYNVTLGQDIDFNWATSREYFIRNGYAVVSILAQRAGVERLKMWSPARYGDLNVSAPNTTPSDPLNTNAHRNLLELVVPRGQMKTNLLGMSFLDRLESWGVQADKVMLHGYPDVAGRSKRRAAAN